MRILAGKYARRELISPPEKITRPTSSKVREAIFNILANYCTLEGSIVLDAFAGSGALGLEALSRGAARVYFIEQNPKAYNTLKQNIYHVGAEANAYLLKRDVTKLPTASEACDIIFLDPPYGKGLVEKAILSLARQKWLRTESYLVIEEATKSPLILPTSFECLVTKHYGDTSITLGHLLNL